MNWKAIFENLDSKTQQAILNDYDNGIKTNQIIEQYNIENVSPSNFFRILPPKEVNELCPYCDVNMFKKRSRNVNVQQDTFCIECGHINFAYKRGKTIICNCNNCIEKAKNERIKKQKKVEERYGGTEWKINFRKIDFQTQLLLAQAICENRFPTEGKIFPKEFFSAEEKYKWIMFLYRLRTEKLISVSPDTPLEAFDDNYFPNRVILGQAIYDINIEFCEEDLVSIRRGTAEWEWIPPEIKIKMLKKYIFSDVLNDLRRLLEERGIELKDNNEDHLKSFAELIDELSYSQLIYLSYKAATFFSDRVVTGRMTKTQAGEKALSGIRNYYTKAKTNSWHIPNADYNFAGDNLRNYVKYVLRRDISFLDEVATVENYLATEVI